MLYKVSLGLCRHSLTTAVNYVEAEDFAQAWAFAQGQRVGREMVQSVEPFRSYLNPEVK